MKIIRDTATHAELSRMAADRFGDMVKAVVDVERALLAVDAELHADLETVLLEDGSKQKNLWGINLYPELKGKKFIEFDSMINLRPSQGNKSRGIDDETIRKKIVEIVTAKIRR